MFGTEQWKVNGLSAWPVSVSRLESHRFDFGLNLFTLGRRIQFTFFLIPLFSGVHQVPSSPNGSFTRVLDHSQRTHQTSPTRIHSNSMVSTKIILLDMVLLLPALWAISLSKDESISITSSGSKWNMIYIHMATKGKVV